MITFGIMEMVSRVKAVLRRCKPIKNTKLLKLEGLVLNPDEHTVTVDGERVVLTYKEYALLHKGKNKGNREMRLPFS